MIKRFIAGMVSITVVLVAWAVLPQILGISTLVWPPLGVVLERGWEARSVLFEEGLYTFGATAIAIASAFAAAIGLSIVAFWFPALHAILEPLIVAGQALPKVVLIPLLFLLISYDIMPGILVGALIAFFPIFTNVRFAIETIPLGLRELATVWRYGKGLYLKEIAIPFSTPVAANTIKLAWIYALIGVISAELLRPNAGIGYLLNEAQARIDGPLFYAAATVSLLIAMIGWTTGSLLDWYARRRFRLERTSEPIG